MCRGHFRAQGCTLLRELQRWKASQGTPDRPGMTVLHGAQTSTSLHLLCRDGDLDVMGFVPVCEDGAQGSVFPCPRWGNSACAAGAQNAAGCSKMAMWKNVNIILSYCLLYVSVALNITMTKVSTERPVGLCRDGVSPREVLMNMSAIRQPHHHLKSAPASSGGWVSVFVALCKEHSNQNHCPGKKSFPYNN